jgi:hypothetical protein
MKPWILKVGVNSIWKGGEHAESQDDRHKKRGVLFKDTEEGREQPARFGRTENGQRCD